MTKPARILSIAGSDSSGGAGIQADIKTITMLGGYAMTAITAVTAQNTLGVQGVEVISADFVRAQVTSCLSDIGIDAIKIGMIGSVETTHTAADMLEDISCPVVFDPVMIASSGAALADADTIAAFERLMGLATLVTPNLPELEALGGLPSLRAKASNILVKGGHQDGDILTDILYLADDSIEFTGPRIETRHTHGTGCTLSSAIATLLGQGHDLPEAVRHARDFVRLALHDAPGFGAEAGPLGHQMVRMDLTEEPRLNQITLAVGDYDDAVLFYRNLELQQIVDSPSNGYARFESSGGTTLSISTGHGETGGASIYLECLDLDRQVERVRASGIECQPPVAQSWGWRESWLTDPDGNRICLYHAGENRRYPSWRIPT